MRTSAEHLIAVVPWTFVGSVLSAGFFVAVMQNNLPPDDLAHDAPIFGHPLALPALFTVAGLSAILVLPIVYLALRKAALLRATLVVYGLVFVEILVVTPIHAIAGWVGSYLALFAALLVCACWNWVNPQTQQAA